MTRRPSWQSGLALALGVIVGVAVVRGAMMSVPPTNCGAVGSGASPLASPMAFSPAQEHNRGTAHWYNFSVQSASEVMDLDNLHFQIQTSVGGIVAPGPEWTAHMANASGTWTGTYSFSAAPAGGWTLGGSEPLTNQQTFALFTTPTNLSNQGDVLLVLLAEWPVDGCSLGGGSMSVSIP